MKEMKRVQMNQNINASLKMRQDIDAEQAEKILKNDEKINRLKRLQQD